MTAEPLRRNRNFTLLWVGGAISTLGTRASSIAMPLLVLALGGSAADAGWVAFSASLPFLVVQLPAGALVDRWNRRIVMLACDAGRALAVGSVGLALLAGRPPLAQLLVVAFVDGTLGVFHALAEQAAVRLLVTDEQLPSALSRTEASLRAAMLTGQPLGGALFAVARWFPFVADLASYLFSLATTVALRGRFRAERPERPERVLVDVVQGLRWLWCRPFLRAAALAVAASNLLFQALYLAVIVILTRQGVSSGVVGAVVAGAGAGGVLGSVVAPWFMRRMSLRRIFVGANWVWAALLPVMAAVHGVVVVAVVFGLVAFVGPTWNVAIGSYQLRITPDDMLARVGSAIGTLTYGALPLGSLLAGFLLDRYGGPGTLWVLAGLMVATAAVISTLPATRRAPAAPMAAPDDVPHPVPDAMPLPVLDANP